MLALDLMAGPNTEIVNTPFVRVLTRCLVSKEPLQQELSEDGVGVEENRPGWEYDINSVHISVTGYFCEDPRLASDARMKEVARMHLS